jgi:formylglycine-generating enzyme required for sulfatase activity
MGAYDETIPGTDVTFRMIPVPGGKLRMGSPADEADRGADEGPSYDVTIEPFWIGRCEVTWSEYKAYMAACDLFKAMESAGMRPVKADNEADAVTAPSNLYDPTTTFTNGEDPLQPAVTMTQFAARQYTKWISGLTSRFYRLPLESEWEYACRAGTATPWHSGGEAAVWPTSLSPRVVRGGSYYDESAQCRSASRRGSEDLPWKDVDPNLPKSPWWYTEEPALGVGMRVVRPLAVPDIAERRRWGDADIESIRADAADRLMQGRGARGLVDPKLPAELKAQGITN